MWRLIPDWILVYQRSAASLMLYENTDRTKPICWVGYWKGSQWVLQVQSQTSKADDGQHAVDIALLFCFWPGVKITDT